MDDSARCVSALCQRRATRRIFPLPASCKPNTSAQTGTPKAAAVKAIAYRYAMCRSQVPAFFDHPCQRPFKIGERCNNRRLTRVKNDVPIDNRPLDPMQPEGRAQPPLDSITDNRSAQRLWYGEPDPYACSIAFAPQAKRGEQRTGYSGTVIIDRPEIGGAQNARRPRERLLAAGAGFNGSSGQLFRR